MTNPNAEIKALEKELANVERNLDRMSSCIDSNPTQERIRDRLYERSDDLTKKIDAARAKAANVNRLRAKVAEKQAMLCAPMVEAFAAIGR